MSAEIRTSSASEKRLRSANPLSLRHFPENGLLPFVLVLWIGYFLLILGITIVRDLSGTVGGSTWDGAQSLPRWFAFGTGIWLTGVHLKKYVAHGMTRRTFLAKSAVFTVAFSVILAALTVLGYQLEKAIFAFAGWQDRLSDRYWYDSQDAIGAIFATFVVLYLLWLTVGALVAVVYRRGGWLPWMPPIVLLCLALLTTAESGLNTDYGQLLPISLAPLWSPPTAGLLIGVAIGSAATAITTALTWRWALGLQITSTTR